MVRPPTCHQTQTQRHHRDFLLSSSSKFNTPGVFPRIGATPAIEFNVLVNQSAGDETEKADRASIVDGRLFSGVLKGSFASFDWLSVFSAGATRTRPLLDFGGGEGEWTERVSTNPSSCCKNTAFEPTPLVSFSRLAGRRINPPGSRNLRVPLPPKPIVAGLRLAGI